MIGSVPETSGFPEDQILIDLISKTKQEGLQAILRHCKETGIRLTVKIGGTAVKDMVDKGKESAVYKVLRSLQESVGGQLLNIVASAAGKMGDSDKKVTQRLIKGFETRESDGWEIIIGIIRDHRDTIERLFSDDARKHEEAMRFLDSTESYLKQLVTEKSEIDASDNPQSKDKVIATGEHMGAKLVSLLLDDNENPTVYLDTRDAQVDYEPEAESAHDALDRLMQATFDKMPNDKTAVIPGHPGAIGESGLIEELGLGYSDNTAVGLNNRFTLFLKQSGSILQADPSKVEGIDPHKIEVMPVSCLLNLSSAIENNLQVIQKRAVEELVLRQGFAFVGDEEGNTSSGTLIVPDRIYNLWKEQKKDKERPVVMGTIDNVREVIFDFMPASDVARSRERQQVIEYLRAQGGKVYDQIETGGKLFVSGIESVTQSGITKIPNIRNISLSDEGTIIAIAYGNNDNTPLHRFGDPAEIRLIKNHAEKLVSKPGLISYFLKKELLNSTPYLCQGGTPDVEKLPKFLGLLLKSARGDPSW